MDGDENKHVVELTGIDTIAVPIGQYVSMDVDVDLCSMQPQGVQTRINRRKYFYQILDRWDNRLIDSVTRVTAPCWNRIKKQIVGDRPARTHHEAYFKNPTKEQLTAENIRFFFSPSTVLCISPSPCVGPIVNDIMKNSQRENKTNTEPHTNTVNNPRPNRWRNHFHRRCDCICTYCCGRIAAR